MAVRLRTLAVVFAVHFLFLLVVWSLLPKSVQENRSNDYLNRSEPVARNFVEGRGFREKNGDLMTRYPPGHPLFLIGVFQAAALTGVPEPIMLALVGLACQAASGMLLFLLATEISSTRTAAVVSLLWLTYPPPLHLTILGNNEVPYLPIFLLSVWVAWLALQRDRGWLYLLCGVLLGLGMLIRPFELALPVFLLVLCLTPFVHQAFGRRLVLASLLLLGTIVTILPWQVWTYRQTNKFYLLSSIGVANTLDGWTYGVPRPERIPLDLPAGVLQLQQSAFDGWQDGTIANFGDLLSWGRNIIQQQPLDLVSMIWRKALRSWYATDSHRWESKLLLLQLPYLLVCLIGCWGCFQDGNGSARMATLVLVIVLYHWAMTVVGSSIMRYIVPIMPLMLLMTAPIVRRLLGRVGWLERPPSVVNPMPTKA